MRISWNVFVPLAAVAALGIGSVIATGVAGTAGEQAPTPDTYATEVAQQRAQLTPARQAPFLQQFNSGTRNAVGLPVVVFDVIDWIGPLSPECLAEHSDLVAILGVTKIEFVSSGMGDLPGEHVTYTVVSNGRGATVGQEVVSSDLGGPYLELNGEEHFILLPWSYEQQVGDRVLAFLSKQPNGTYTPDCPGWSTFKLNPDGTVADQPGAAEAGVAGKAASAVLSAYAAGN